MRLSGGPSFARRFRRLSDRQRRAFLAAVWSARGYETTVENDGIAARRDGETLRIGLVGWWPRGDSEADLLVGTRDTARARSYAADQGVEFLGPAEIRDLLLYGLDRAAAEGIVREWMDRPLSAFAARSPETEPPAGAIRASAYAVAIAALLVLAGGAIFAGPFGTDAPEDRSVDASELGTYTATPEPTDTTGPTEGNEPTDTSVGANSEGLDNVTGETLLERHRERIANQSYTLTVRYTKPANSAPPVPTLLGNVTHYERTLQVNGTEATLSQTAVSAGSEPTEISLEGYQRNGFVRTRIVERNDTAELNNVTYTQLDRSPSPFAGYVADTERTFVDALSANFAEVTTVRRPERPFYRVRVTTIGDPDEWVQETEGYRAVVDVTSGGQFVLLSVSYTDPATGELVSVRLKFSGVGTTEVAVPEWAEQSEPTNESQG